MGKVAKSFLLLTVTAAAVIGWFVYSLSNEFALQREANAEINEKIQQCETHLSALQWVPIVGGGELDRRRFRWMRSHTEITQGCAISGFFAHLYWTGSSLEPGNLLTVQEAWKKNWSDIRLSVRLDDRRKPLAQADARLEQCCGANGHAIEPPARRVGLRTRHYPDLNVLIPAYSNKSGISTVTYSVREWPEADGSLRLISCIDGSAAYHLKTEEEFQSLRADRHTCRIWMRFKGGRVLIRGFSGELLGDALPILKTVEHYLLNSMR